MKWLLVVVAACGAPDIQAPDAGVTFDAATPAALAVSGLGLDFGSLTVGIPSAGLALDIANTGGSPTGPITITTDHPQIALMPDTCLALAPGAHCTTFATATLTTSGTLEAQIVATATPGSTASATVHAIGHFDEGFSISPAGHEFGDLAVGATSGAQVFTVTNGGGSVTGALSVTGTGSVTQFVVQSDTCTGATLGPAQACTVAIAFAPVAATPSAAASFAISGTPGGTVTATVHGVAHVPAPLAISPAVWDFGAASSSCHDNTKTFTVTNNQASTTVPLTTAISGSGFAIHGDTCTGQALAPQGTCTIAVDFSFIGPAGTKTGALVATAGTSSTTADLSGTAAADSNGFLQAAPTSLTFGTLGVGSTSSSMTFTLTNLGACPTSAIHLAFMGQNPNDFAVASDACTNATLANNESCIVGVRFTPTTGGSRTAGLSVSATTGGTATVGLTGTGQSGPIAVAPPSHDFGSISPDDTCKPRTQVFTFTNNTAVPTGSLVTTLSGSGFSVAADACSGANLAANESCTVAVHFDGTFPAGAKSGALDLAGTTLTAQALVSGAVITATNLTDNAPLLAFGTVTPGTTSMMSVTFTNDTASPTGALLLEIAGMDPSSFTTTSDGCTSTSLANLQSCVVTFAFSPTTATSRTAQATVTGMPGVMACVALSGD